MFSVFDLALGQGAHLSCMGNDHLMVSILSNLICTDRRSSIAARLKTESRPNAAATINAFKSLRLGGSCEASGRERGLLRYLVLDLR